MVPWEVAVVVLVVHLRWRIKELPKKQEVLAFPELQPVVAVASVERLVAAVEVAGLEERTTFCDDPTVAVVVAVVVSLADNSVKLHSDCSLLHNRSRFISFTNCNHNHPCSSYRIHSYNDYNLKESLYKCQ